LGVQVLYESLHGMSAEGIQRNFRPLNLAPTDTWKTFFVCGLATDPAALNPNRWETLLESVSTSGGRLVIAFTASPGDASTPGDAEESHDASFPKDDSLVSNKTGNHDDHEPDPGLWGLDIALRSRTLTDEQFRNQARRVEPGIDALPDQLVWRSAMYFELGDLAWKTIFTFANQSVVATRSWGQGELVMVADSYLFSNEALRNHRASTFLAWTLQPDRRVVFDEFHHGLSKQPGIAGLVRKYRLHGVVLSLLLITVLLIWRQAVVFVPRSEDDVEAERQIAFGRDAADGWVSLMQQHIAKTELLAVCHQAWQAGGAADRVPEDRAEGVRELIAQYGAAPRQHNLVTVYRSICKLLKQG
jgi:hypothetical protein